MALHKLYLDEFCDTSFSLIAIHCRIEDYRLAYLLNKHLGIHLARREYDLDYKYLAAAYSIYEWDDKNLLTTWNLVSNVCKKEEDSLQSTGSLFNSKSTVLKTYHLLPEFKNVDYFIKISNDNEDFNDKLILNQLQSISQIITSYRIDTTNIKSKDNLIF